jgi:type VI secretion system VasD/TssJ family lipoprotein
MHGSKMIRKGVWFWLLIWLSSCASGPKQLMINIQGTQEMNNRKACVIYVYLLKTDTNFLSTTSLSFWQQESEPFSDDIIAKRRYQLVPGDTKTEGLMLTDETNFIGAVADFNDPDKEGWRRVLPIDKNTGKEIYIVVDYNRIEIQ